MFAVAVLVYIVSVFFKGSCELKLASTSLNDAFNYKYATCTFAYLKIKCFSRCSLNNMIYK